MMMPPTERELIDFVYLEARLLDQQRWDEWLALFASECNYWVPLQGARQADPHAHNSLAYEDRLLLSLRVERLKGARAHSQRPPSHGQHVLQQPCVEHRDDRDDGAGQYGLCTPFMYLEARGEQQLVLGGVCRHTLERVGGVLRIRLKRVDLLNAEAAFPAIQLFP